MEVGANQSEGQNESDQQEKPISAGQPVTFDWQNRWLKGHQYAFILKNIDAYCAKYGFIKFDFKTHPPSIYQNPVSKFRSEIDGMIYFVKGAGVGSDFGFPRVAKKKKYRWKKMNFTTDLPKQMPHVTYVVASAMKAQLIQNDQEIPNFRMHAVIPYKDRLKQYSKFSEYILCHVRKVEKKKPEEEENTLKDCISHHAVDFYKLFYTLHNLSLNNQNINNQNTDNFSL